MRVFDFLPIKHYNILRRENIFFGVQNMEKNKKYIIAVIALIVAFALGFGVKALCCCGGKIAVIDINQVVSEAKEVKDLQQVQQQRSQELQKWVESVKAEVEKEASKQKKDELTKKYDAEFMSKYQAMQESYNNEVKQLEGKITKIIADKAKADGFIFVLAKNTVLTGGKDITDAVVELVK